MKGLDRVHAILRGYRVTPLTVRLPAVGIRRHRLFLTDRPMVIECVRIRKPVLLGHDIVSDTIDEGPQTRWTWLSVLCVLLIVVAGCAMAVRP